MIKTFTTVLLLLTLSLNAQTLTYTNFSVSLSATLNVVIADNSSFNIALTTTTGSGVTWDASALVQQAGTPGIHLAYASPAATPYSGMFSGSNYCEYDPALTSVLSYEYYQITADSMIKWGNYEPSTEHEIYQDPDKHLIFPFAYGQTFTDNYSKTNYSNATTVSSYQTGTRTVTFNGYGTLILPQGTFTNVALISEMRTNSLGPNSTTFNWIDISNGKRLMFYSENDGNITTVFNTDLSTGIIENSVAGNVSVFPNPVTSSSMLQLDTKTSKNVVIKINDMFGKEVRSTSVSGNQIIIEKKQFDSGMYCYKIIDGKKIIATGKFIVE